MSDDLLPLSPTAVAQALSFALQFAGEGLRKGLQGDLYAKLRDAVWNRMLEKKVTPQEAEVFTSVSAHPDEADRHLQELKELIARIDAQLDEKIADLARQVLNAHPSAQTPLAGRDNVNVGRDNIKAGGHVNTGVSNVRNSKMNFTR